MSYHSSYQKTTTTTTTSNGVSYTTTTTTGDSSLVVRELTESEVSNLSLSDSPSNYEISNQDGLTKYEFYSLMDSEDSDSDTESNVEYNWFPSLLRNSIIQFLDDKEQENYIEDDTFDKKFEIIENEQESKDKDQDKDEDMHINYGGKRYYRRHTKKHAKRPRKSEQVPVEVIHISL